MLFIFLCLFELVFGQQNPLVITKYGPVSGNSFKTPSGATVFEFLGIPFAAPPIGNLRFEKPRSPTPWVQPLNTTVYSPACVPCIKENLVFSEDCLYLNVWTPALNNSLYPVVVYIHGGGYLDGTGQMNNQIAREVYAQNGIVFVSIQYRLGFLGFMTLNDSRLEPNLGLWDQNLALKWVQDNIGRFGGDQKRVTIWGTSAGGSSVGQHTLSPKSQGLFAQAFEQSGSALAAFARGDFNIQTTLNLLVQLNCPTTGDVKGCLRSKQLDDFYSLIGTCHADDFTIFELSPMVDGDFFTEQPEEAIAKAPPVPTLIGLNEKEGRLFTLQSGLPFAIKSADYSTITDDSFYAAIEDWVVNRGYNDQAQDAAQEIFNFYAQNHTDPNDHYFWIEQYTRLFSDFILNVATLREAVGKANANFPVYAFVLDYYNQQTWPKDNPCQGSTHVSEMPYCLGIGTNFQPTADDLTVSSLMQEFIIQFIKTGNPQTPSINWTPFSSNNLNYLSFNTKPSMAKGLFGESYDFWTNRMQKFNFDYITRRDWIDI